MTDNNVQLIGNVTRQPELKFLPSGSPLVEFGLAVNRRWKNRQDQWEEQTSFFDVTAFGQMGENVAESIPSGTRVIVTGRLQQESWEAKDGQKRSKVKVIADEVAPSLRWATAQVTKIERQAASGGGGSQAKPQTTSFGEEPFAAPAEVWDL